MTYHVTAVYKQNHSTSWSLQSSIVVNQYIKSLPLAGYEQYGMTEDTKGTLTYDQEL